VVTVTAILATVWSKSFQTVYQARGRIWSVGVDLCAGSLAFNPPPGATPGHSIIVAVRGAEVVGMACLAPPHKWTPADAAGDPAPSSRKLVGEELRLSIAPVREAFLSIWAGACLSDDRVIRPQEFRGTGLAAVLCRVRWSVAKDLGFTHVGAYTGVSVREGGFR